MITDTKRFYKHVDIKRYPELNHGARALLRSLTMLTKLGTIPCHYSDTDAAKELGVAERTVRNYFALLEQKGYIEIGKTFLGKNKSRRLITVNPDKLVLANQEQGEDLAVPNKIASDDALDMTKQQAAPALTGAKAQVSLALSSLSASMEVLALTERDDLDFARNMGVIAVPDATALGKHIAAVGKMLSPRTFYAEEALLMLYNIGIGFPLLEIAEQPFSTRKMDIMVDYTLKQGAPFPAIRTYLVEDTVPQGLKLTLNELKASEETAEKVTEKVPANIPASIPASAGNLPASKRHHTGNLPASGMQTDGINKPSAETLTVNNQQLTYIYIPTSNFDRHASDVDDVDVKESKTTLTIDSLTSMPNVMLQDDLSALMVSHGFKAFRPSEQEHSFKFDFTPLHAAYSWRQAWQERQAPEFRPAYLSAYYKREFFLWYTLNELTRASAEVVGRDAQLYPRKYEESDFEELFYYEQGHYSLAIFLLRAMYPDDPLKASDFPGRPIANRLENYYHGGRKLGYLNKVLANAVIEGLSDPKLFSLAYNAFYEVLQRSTLNALINNNALMGPLEPQYLSGFYDVQFERMFSLDSDAGIPCWRLSYPLLLMRKVLLVNYLQWQIPASADAMRAFTARAAILALAFHPNVRYDFACLKAAHQQRYSFLSEMEAHHV